MQVNDLFTFTKAELQETKEELEVTNKNLEQTTETLTQTKGILKSTRKDRDEQRHLVSHHVKSEAKLHSQATQVGIYNSKNH